MGLLTLALDPTSRFRTMDAKFVESNMERQGFSSLEEYFQSFSRSSFRNINDIVTAWGKRKEMTEEEEATTRKRQKFNEAENTKGRSNEYKNVQKKVPTWYNKCCVLSGMMDPQGAHIVPIRAINKRVQGARVIGRLDS